MSTGNIINATRTVVVPTHGLEFHRRLGLPSGFPSGATAIMEKHGSNAASELRLQPGSALFNLSVNHGLKRFLPPKTTAEWETDVDEALFEANYPMCVSPEESWASTILSRWWAWPVSP
jgi:hypothetical protein